MFFRTDAATPAATVRSALLARTLRSTGLAGIPDAGLAEGAVAAGVPAAVVAAGLAGAVPEAVLRVAPAVGADLAELACAAETAAAVRAAHLAGTIRQKHAVAVFVHLVVADLLGQRVAARIGVIAVAALERNVRRMRDTHARCLLVVAAAVLVLVCVKNLAPFGTILVGGPVEVVVDAVA